jgi:hypothetical protein
VLRLADLHADESLENGSRIFDRGGIWQFAKDLLAAAPAAPAPQLPPMPEPHWPRCYQGSVPPGAYTADQMQAYARAAIEAASKGEQA